VTVTGVVWHDLDENRTRDLTEAGLSGWTVYADLDGDGERDLGEPSKTTDSQGRYSLATTVTGGTLTIAKREARLAADPAANPPWLMLTVTGGGTWRTSISAATTTTDSWRRPRRTRR
jgi:hypothetical protein